MNILKKAVTSLWAKIKLPSLRLHTNEKTAKKEHPILFWSAQ